MFSLSSYSFGYQFFTLGDLSKKSQCKHIRFKRAFEFLQLFLLQRVYGIDTLTRSSIRQMSSEEQGQYEVFLGGSCNPTTWRREMAIPFFQSYSISYYNPQVCEWTPDLLEKEHEAKESARLLFFVIDNDTRALASIIETSYLAARERNIVVILPRMPKDKYQAKFIQQKKIADEKDNDEDYENVCEARQILQVLIQTRNVPIFDNIRAGLECARFMIKSKCRNITTCDTSDEEDMKNNARKMSILSSKKTSFESPDGFNREFRLKSFQLSESASHRRYSTTVITSETYSTPLVPCLRSINDRNDPRKQSTKRCTKSQVSFSTNESDDDGYGSLVSSNHTLSRSSSSCLTVDCNENFSDHHYKINTSIDYLRFPVRIILNSIFSTFASMMNGSGTSNISMLESIYILCTVSFRFIHNNFFSRHKTMPKRSKTSVHVNHTNYMFDLYVALGSNDENWFNTQSLPKLKELNLKYVQRLTNYDDSQNDVGDDIHVRNQSRLLYYLINDTERLSNLVTELAFLIGERTHRIIVYLQSTIDDSTDRILTTNERQDIERSRKYLEDIAIKEHVLVCQSREESWYHVLTYLRHEQF